MKKWLERPQNDRLSVKNIFENLDLYKSGILGQRDFDSALLRLGIQLRDSELKLVFGALDEFNSGLAKYRSLVREL